MVSIVCFLRGSALLEVEGAFPERFLNLCATENLSFWGLRWQNKNKLQVAVGQRESGRVLRLAERAGCSLTVLQRSGLPAFLWQFRRRYALLLGLGLTLVAVCLLSQFVLTVEVTGNVHVTTAEILSALGRQGVKPGEFGPAIDPRQAAQGTLLELEELSFLSVNLHGTRAEVVVRERRLPPKIADESVPADVVAAAPGIITHMEVTRGQPRFKEGDTVAAGETLISGTVELEAPLYSEVEMGALTVRAGGRVFARTWRTLSAEIPLTAQVKTYTGRESTRFSAVLLGSTINFYGKSGISFPKYDKIRTTQAFTLPGGQRLPATLTRERLREYVTEPVTIDAAAAQALLQQQLQARLASAIGAGTVLKAEYRAEQGDATLTVTLQAECREEISRTVERKP